MQKNNPTQTFMQGQEEKQAALKKEQNLHGPFAFQKSNYEVNRTQ